MEWLDQLREIPSRIGPAPVAMAPYLEKVRDRAYSITDADVEALKQAGCTDDEIFEQTVAVAIAQGFHRFDAGLEALR